MSVGYNQHQAILANAIPGPMPYSPSYSVPIQQNGPAPLPQQPMRADSFESTRDKSIGDVVGGFFTGAGKAIYDMGGGLFFLGKGAAHVLDNPISSLSSLGGAVVHGVTHPIQTAETVVKLPFTIAKGIVKPYSQAMEQGRYGEALGRLAVDVTVIAASLNGGNKPPSPGDVADDVGNIADDVGGIADDIGNVGDDIGGIADDVGKATGGAAGGGGSVSNNLSGNVGDTIIEEIGKVGNITGNGNTVNINIGNIQVGGANMTGNTISTASKGASQAARTAGSVIDDVGSIADDVGSIADDVGNAGKSAAAGSSSFASTSQAAASSTVGNTATKFAQASGQTIGARIGGGIDAVLAVPNKIGNVVGGGFRAVGRGIENVGRFIAHPIESLRGFRPNLSVEGIANGIRAGGNALANGLVYASKNPMHAAMIAGAVGRGGKAAEDILTEMDLVRQ